MGDKPTPVGTEKITENPALTDLKNRERLLTEKLEALEKSDANKFAHQRFDLEQVKQATRGKLAEIKAAIKELAK